MKSSKRIEAIATQLIANGKELVGSGAVITTVGNKLLEQGETLMAQTTKLSRTTTDASSEKQESNVKSDSKGGGRGLAPVSINDITEFSAELKNALTKNGIKFTSDLRATSKTKLRTDYADIENGLSQLASFLNYPSLTSEGKRGRKAGSKNKTTNKASDSKQTTAKTSEKRGRKEVKLTDMGIFSKGLKKKFKEEGITTAQELRSTPKSELRTKFSGVKNGLQQLADYLNYPSLTGNGQRGRKPASTNEISSNKHSIKELGLANKMFQKLESAGFKFAEDIASAEVGELTNIKGIGAKRANQLMEEAQKVAS